MEEELKTIIAGIGEIKERLTAIEERLDKLESKKGDTAPLAKYFEGRVKLPYVARKLPRLENRGGDDDIETR